MEKVTMSGRLLPNRDYQKVITHDKIYAECLSQKLEFNIIKEDILNKKCSMILARQTKETILKNIDLLCEWANVKLICLDIKAHLNIQNRLVVDKEKHYNEVFLPQFKKELEECNKHFDSILKDCRQFVIDKPTMSEEILPKIEYELHWYDSLTESEQKEEEYKLQLYKPIRRLFQAYTKMTNNAE
jgi:hypothetical protein